MKKRGVIALSEIIILLLGIISIGYLVGSEIKIVAANEIKIQPPSTSIPVSSNDAWPIPEDVSDVAPPIDPKPIPKGTPTPIVPKETPTPPGFLSSLFSVNKWWGSFTWGLSVYAGTQVLGRLFGLEQSTTNAASAALGLGTFAGIGSYYLLKNVGDLSAKSAGIWGGVIGVGVGAIVFLMMYKKENTQVVTFECFPWDAPVGGERCEECNKQKGGLPCSEYQCRSLGQACKLENPGTKEALCVWAHKNDVNPPVINPRTDSLLADYRYSPDNTVSPPDRGVKIQYTKTKENCVPAFTPLTFGINTDEPARCKLDYVRKNTFDEMGFYFGGSSTFKYNHTQVMSLPGPSAEENGSIILQNDGTFKLYTRCQDSNGNTNVATFQFSFCVDEGPDTTPPQIVTTNLLNGMPISYNQTELDLEVYTNEPATCKWSRRDQAYKDMEETMSCSRNVFEMNAQMLYKCSTTLTGLKDRVENEFFFRCEDKPNAPENDRNVNQQSYDFTVIGTQPLVINSVGPNETIRDSTDVVKVELNAKTSAGHEEGRAFCYFKSVDEDEYIEFVETDSSDHSQELFLTEGDYEYNIKCVDLGGNSDEETTSFSVEVDDETPVVVRAFHEENYMKIITDEEGECVYNTNPSLGCNYLFSDGNKMTVVDKVEHYTDWNTESNLYIKCKDQYDNQPLPNQCSITVRPYQNFESDED